MKLPLGHQLRHFERVDSTNSEARRLSEAGEPGPLWVWADEQTAGRGRLGRLWQSPTGNLHVTLLIELGAAPAVASQLGFVAALAVHDMVSTFMLGRECLLKWPNDVLLDGAKLSGLLTEVIKLQPLTVAIGFGINVREAPSGFPYATACIGDIASPELVLQRLAPAFAARLTEWDDGRGFAQTRLQWLQRAHKPGASVLVDGKSYEFAGLAENGGLRIKSPDGAIELIQAGDVQMATAVPA